MSKEVFLLPSAKQILSYENGDIRSDEVSTLYRFHILSTYLWIEPSKNGYEIKIRGRMLNDGSRVFIANSRTISVCSDLFSAVTTFARMVSDITMLYNITIKDSVSFDLEGIEDALS